MGLRPTVRNWLSGIFFAARVMSYDISLTDPVTGETLELDAPHHMRGGTYASVVGAPSKDEIAARLRKLADEMNDIAVQMDYYGGFAEWSRHGREISGAGKIARQWAEEIEASNAEPSGPPQAGPAGAAG